MLSILIPVYNYDVRALVLELHKQCLECKIDFEILVQDDASESVHNIKNEQINTLSQCSFVSLQQNIAHRENRNLLARHAKFDYLLFIDGDSNCLNPSYIVDFVFAMHRFDVVYGGRLHPINCPSKNHILRWKYGKFREDKVACLRKKAPFINLLFNNTVIRKAVFESIKFDASFKKYGHDDTQLSFELSKKNISVLHIDNQIEHGDIDFSSDYLNKTKQAVENLYQFYKQNSIDYKFIKILKFYHVVRILKIKKIIVMIFNSIEPELKKQLLGSNPHLSLFDFYKIGYLCTLDANN